MHHHSTLIAQSLFSHTDFLDTTPSVLDPQQIDFEHQQQQYIAIERMRLRGPTVDFASHNNDLGTCTTCW